MRIVIFISMLIQIISCGTNKQREFKEFRKKDRIVKGYILNDSSFDDTVYSFDLYGRLVQKDFYQQGKRQGNSFTYYSNGVVKGITKYIYGLKSGENYYFDTSGKRFYSDFYYYDLSVGPVIYYDSAGMPKKFVFISLENKTLIDIDYRNWKGVNEIALDFINYTYEEIKEDSEKKMYLFIYLIKPPRFSIKYTLLKRNKKDQRKYLFVQEINSKYPFAGITVPVLNDSLFYSITLNVYDSILKRNTIIDKEVW